MESRVGYQVDCRDTRVEQAAAYLTARRHSSSDRGVGKLHMTRVGHHVISRQIAAVEPYERAATPLFERCRGEVVIGVVIDPRLPVNKAAIRIAQVVRVGVSRLDLQTIDMPAGGQRVARTAPGVIDRMGSLSHAVGQPRTRAPEQMAVIDMPEVGTPSRAAVARPFRLEIQPRSRVFLRTHEIDVELV